MAGPLIDSSRLARHWWALALRGVAPGAGALALVWLIAAFAVVDGIVLLVLSFRLRGLGRDTPSQLGRVGPEPGAA